MQLQPSNSYLHGFLPPLTAPYLTRAMDSPDNLSQKHFKISSRNWILSVTIPTIPFVEAQLHWLEKQVF